MLRAMEPRRRDLLAAEADYLSEYCGEDALQRWQAKLSDAEREQLAAAPGVVSEVWTRFVETLRRMFWTLGEVLAAMIRVVYEALTSALATIGGHPRRLFGPEAL